MAKIASKSSVLGAVSAVSKKKKEAQLNEGLQNVVKTGASNLQIPEVKNLNPPAPSSKIGTTAGTPAGSKNTFQVGNKVVSEKDYKKELDVNQAFDRGGLLKKGISPELLAQREGLASEVGVTPPPTIGQLAQEREEASIGGAIRRGIAGAGIGLLPNIITGVAGGAVIGGAGTGGVGAPVGAAIGGIGMGLSSISKNMQAEARETADSASKILSTNKRNMRRIISQANAGNIDPTLAVAEYNRNLAEILSEERKLKELTKTEAREYISGGKVKMVEIQAFTQNELIILNEQMKEAVLMPKPNSLYAMEYLNEQ